MATCQFHDDHGACSATAVRSKEFCARHTLKTAAPAVSEETILEATATPAPRRAPRAEPPSEDLEALGGRIAELMAAQDAQERLRRSAKPALRDKDGYRLKDETKRVPLKVIPRRVRADSTLIVDPHTGQVAVKAGWLGRWVRERDHENRPTEARVCEFEDFGYEIVRDSTGQPIKSLFGVAMMAPPEQYALRVREYSPTGSLNRNELLASTESAIDEANAAAGIDAVSLYRDPKHRSERVLVSSGVEALDEE